MTNLTIDIMAATPIGAVAPVAAGVGVDFDALVARAAPPAPDIVPPIVLAPPAYVAASLPIGRQGFAGAANPVAADPVDLPAADAPDFWIALEAEAPAPARLSLAVTATAVETPAAPAQIAVAPAVRSHNDRALIAALQAVANRVVAAPVIDKPAAAAVVVAPRPDLVAADVTVRVAEIQPRLAVAAPATTPTLPSSLRCAPIENGKPAYKRAAVLFETTAMSPPLVKSPAVEARVIVGEPAPDPTSITIKDDKPQDDKPQDDEPAASIARADVVIAPLREARSEQASIETPVIPPAKATIPPTQHSAPPKHALATRMRTALDDAESSIDLTGSVPDEERGPPTPEAAQARLQPDPPPLPIAPMAPMPTVPPERIALAAPATVTATAMPMSAQTVVAHDMMRSAATVTPLVTSRGASHPSVATPSVAAVVAMPITIPISAAAPVEIAARSMVAPSAPAPQPGAPIVMDLRAAPQVEIAPPIASIGAQPLTARSSAPAAPAIIAAPVAGTDSTQPAAPSVIDLHDATQPVAVPLPVAPTIAQPVSTVAPPSVPSAVADAPRTVVETPPSHVAAPAPPIVPVAVAPVALRVVPAVVVHEAVKAARADDAVDEVDTAIAAATPAQTIASITPRAVVTAPGPVTVDTTRIDWIEALVDRIDENRGASGHRSAHIRLLPDALGAVDVRIQHDGDRVNVAVTADNPQARALLAEAAPRLAELAESRGLKLGDAGIDQGRQGQRSAGQQQPSAPPSAPATAEPDPATDDMSDRIA